jgi:hypothetical protein
MKKSCEMWSRLYISAILETDTRKRPQRIKEAERAIRERLSGSVPIDPPERQILASAKTKLQTLKSEQTAYLRLA